MITAAFVPGQDAEFISNADLFCVDVRNGYLYGSYTDQEIYREDFVTLDFDRKLDMIKDDLVHKMVPRLTSYVKELLGREEIYISDKSK